MIQRIQSIFLALAIIFSALLFFVPVFNWTGPGQSYDLGILETVQYKGETSSRLTFNSPLIVLCVFIILLSAFALFDFTRRIRQARLCHLLVLFQLVLISLVMYDFEQVGVMAGDGYSWHLQPGIFFLLTPVLLFLLARRYILKDEALVKSADRLR